MLLPSSLQARTEVEPYIEIDQTIVANIKGGTDDVLTYTSLVAGVDASATGRRTEGQLSVRYEHQIGWDSRTPDADIVSGIARGRHRLTRDLSLEGGAFASRYRSGGFGSGIGRVGDTATGVYSIYAGPVLSTQVGDLALNGSYRLGYSRVDRDLDLDGLDAFDLADDSVHHEILASAGMQPRDFPVGWTLSAGYEREDADPLDQRFERAFVRLDLMKPVTRTIALVGGIGYEDIDISQRRILTDGNGDPVLTPGGRPVGDRTAPRLLSYDVDGLIWDAGLAWRPSRRTSAEFRVGRRYDSTYYTGELSWRPNRSSLLQVLLFDRIDSFGRALGGNLAALPFGFDIVRNPFTGDLLGCVGGADGGACFNDALSALYGANYRHRGVIAQYSRNRDRWDFAAGLGYSRRRFIAPPGTLVAGLEDAEDAYLFAQLYAARQLSPVSPLSASLYANHLDAAADGFDVSNYGGYLQYNRLLGRRIRAQASVGLDAVDAPSVEEIIRLLAQVGLQYRF